MLHLKMEKSLTPEIFKVNKMESRFSIKLQLLFVLLHIRIRVTLTTLLCDPDCSPVNSSVQSQPPATPPSSTGFSLQDRSCSHFAFLLSFQDSLCRDLQDDTAADTLPPRHSATHARPIVSISNTPWVLRYRRAWSLKLTCPKTTGSNDAGSFYRAGRAGEEVNLTRNRGHHRRKNGFASWKPTAK